MGLPVTITVNDMASNDFTHDDVVEVEHGYTNQVFPTTGAEVLTVNYYDTYDFDFNNADDYAYIAEGLPGEGAPATTIIGLPSGSKRLVLGTSTWLTEYYFYDADGRVIQKRSNNHLSAAIDNLPTIVYDFGNTMRAPAVLVRRVRR